MPLARDLVLEAEKAAHVADETGLAVDEARLHVFDAESEERVDA